MLVDILIYAPTGKVIGIYLTDEKLKFRWTYAEADEKKFLIIRKDFDENIDELMDLNNNHYRLLNIKGDSIKEITDEGFDQGNIYSDGDFEITDENEWNPITDPVVINLKTQVTDLKAQAVALQIQLQAAKLIQPEKL